MSGHRPVRAVDWGQVSYRDARERQLGVLAERQRGDGVDTLVFVEHPHVITVGRTRSAQANVLAAGDVDVIEVERGGDVTYHGPGQIVCYPIIALDDGERDLHAFLRHLEQAMIDTVARWGIDAGRETGKTGVWTRGRKLASIGIACRKWVTFHGLALNVTTDLTYFARINPCGFDAGVMTSIAAERPDVSISIGEVKRQLAHDLARALVRTLI